MIDKIWSIMKQELKKAPLSIIAMTACVAMLYLNNSTIQALSNKVEVIRYDLTVENEEGSVAFAYKVIEYGLHEARSEEDVYSIIKIWDKEKWGAQIGALKLLCEKDSKNLDKIMVESTKVNVCRLVN